MDNVQLKQHWCNEIEQYEKDSRKWVERSKKIVKLYKDERKDENATQVRYNILWSNVQTLKPALYAKDPTPEVERRFKDEDDIGRSASDVLERCLSYSVSCSDFGDVMKSGVLDKLLTGRATAWVRYVPHFRDHELKSDNEEISEEGSQVTDDAEIESADEHEAEQELAYEEIVYDYVYYEDFGHTRARTWQEVTGIWRIAYLSRQELIDRFPKCGQEIPLDQKAEDAPEDTSNKKASIYEIWDKSTKKAIWLSKEYPTLLDMRDDPLDVEGFFPCPKPMFATHANDTVIPVPDYALYQDQANSLDELSQRIAMITKAIKVAGVYDTSAAGISRLLNEGVENQLIPVDNWAAFAEKGGLQGAMSMLPVAEVAQVLHTLYDIREKVKQDLYEISGMSDIIRGASDPSETATAQQIKSNYASVRLNDMQRDVQRFARDLLRIAGQIIANHFQVDTIKQISGVKLLTQAEKQHYQMLQQPPAPPQGVPPQPPQIPEDVQELMSQPTWEEVDQLLKNNASRSFRIDIETDSTILQDAQQEQQSRLEFVQTIGQALQQAAAIVQQAPPLIAPIAESMMFLIRSYKVGRPTEAAFQEAIDKMVEISKQPPRPPPKEPDSQVQVEQMKQQGTQQLEQMKQQGTEQLTQVSAQTQAQLENQKHSNRMTEIAAQHTNAKEIAAMQLQHANMMAASKEANQHHTEDSKIQAQAVIAQDRLAHEAYQAEQDRAAQSLQQSANQVD